MILSVQLNIGVTEGLSLLLVGVLLFLGFRILESGWSYRISKPYAWEDAVKNGMVSEALIQTERRYRDKVRFYTFWLQTRRLTRDQIAGNFAEVGVYRGETARMLHQMDPDRKLLLFDTFSGFDKRDLMDGQVASENMGLTFSDTAVEEVNLFIRGNENVIFYPGYFPESAPDLTDLFALVHLDADLYLPTLAALKYFYPRMSAGGVIIIHDVNHNWSGVRKALSEFMVTVPESLAEVADWQGSAMLIKT